MQMKAVLEKLEKLRGTPSLLDKKKLLKNYLEDETFKTVVEMSLDGLLHFNITKLPDNKTVQFPPNFEELINFLYYLTTKQGANKEEKQKLVDLCFDDNWREVVLRIIKKDLKCGVGGKLVNEVCPNLISIIPYMRCGSTKRLHKIRYPAIVQNKEDGSFVNIFRYNDKIKYLSRNGNEYLFPEDGLEKEIREYFPIIKNTPMVYMGEFRVLGKNKEWLPRKTSNGIVNKALKKNMSIKLLESSNVRFICWDAVPVTNFWKGEYLLSYEKRFKTIQFLENNKKFKRCLLCETVYVDNVEEAQEFAQAQIAKGEEGGVLKDLKSKWSNNQSKRIIKLKAGDIGIGNERECELRVIDYYLGKFGSKYEKCLGGLLCQSEDGLLETNIGGGFSDKDRFFGGMDDNGYPVQINWEVTAPLIKEKYINKIITVRFNEVIFDKKGSKARLFLARFKEIREDKDYADTLNDIKEML